MNEIYFKLIDNYILFIFENNDNGQKGKRK